MPPIINQEWLNENSLRAYPFRENLSRKPIDANGNVIPDIVIPDYLIVDFVLTLAADTLEQVYLSQLVVVGDLVTLVFSDSSGIQIGIVSASKSTHTIYDAYDLIGVGVYEDARGRVVLGDLDDLADDLAEGQYTFTLTATELEPSTVRPAVRGVRSLRTSVQGTESERIFGHVKLLAGTNIRLTYLSEYNAIRIDAIDGTGLNEECECEESIGQTNIVRTINGIALEDVEITGDGVCVDVTESGNRLVISDLCSSPCCGCPELEFITENLKILETTLTNLESYANQLQERISNFVTNVVLTIT